MTSNKEKINDLIVEYYKAINGYLSIEDREEKIESITNEIKEKWNQINEQ